MNKYELKLDLPKAMTAVMTAISQLHLTVLNKTSYLFKKNLTFFDTSYVNDGQETIMVLLQ